MDQLNRRQAIHRVGLLLGGTLAAPTLAGVLGGCNAPTPGGSHHFTTLDAGQQELISAIADQIIPTTDTPGASEAGVTEFFDLMLSDWYPADDREQFLNALSAFDLACGERYGQSFVECSSEDQITALRASASAVEAARRSGTRPLPVFATLKELTMVGYYTSEIGMTVELQHEVVPGVFNGCVPLDEIGRTWA